MIRLLPGLKHCEIIKYAYAIEYDAIDPLELNPNLETKKSPICLRPDKLTEPVVMKKPPLKG